MARSINLPPAAAERARQLHQFGLERARAIGHFALSDRDSEAKHLASAEDIALPLDGRTLRGRTYTPLEGEPRGLLIYFHGGGFVVGDIDSHDALCRRISAAGAMKVVSVGYRLAPEHPFPAQLQDALDAADAIAAWAETPLAIGGDSAGGYLALSTALARPGRFAAQLLIYPLLHVEETLWADSVFHDARIVGRMAVRYIRAQLHTEGVAAPSLLELPMADVPATVLISGGALDPVRPDAVVLAGRLAEAGVACDMQDYGVQPHGFLNLTHVSPIAREAAKKAGESLSRMMRS
jgi:acetyl esterase